MSKNALLACMVAALAAAGCTASMNANVTPGLPGASAGPSAAPGTAASAKPTTPTTGGSSAPATGSVNAALATIYKLGRKWEYEVRAVAAGMTTTTSFTQEVTKVEGGKATVKIVTTAMGKSTDSTSEVDLTQADPMVVVSKSGNTTSTWSQSAVGDESITVKAGTYAAKKYTGKFTAQSSSGGASASNAQDATFWVSLEVGLLKSITKGSQSMSAGYALNQLPAGISLPGGMSMPTAGALPTAGGTIEFESTTELVSVTK